MSTDQPNPFGDPNANPFQPPQSREQLSSPSTQGHASGIVKGPAIGMLVVAPLGILLCIADFVMRIINIQSGNIPVRTQRGQPVRKDGIARGTSRVRSGSPS